MSRTVCSQATPSLVLISTSDVISGRDDELARMVKSVEAFRAGNPGMNVRLFLLLQRCSQQEKQMAIAALPDWVDVHTFPDRLPLSKARNHLITLEATGTAIGRNDIVAFPDDDCWYPEGLLQRVIESFQSTPELDFWFCRYSSNPESPQAGADIIPALQQIISRASSNTMFIRGNVVKSVGYFDERLGIGAEINGGEDTDYALRVWRQARKVVFVNSQLIGHRDPDPKFRSRYFTGSFVAIARNTGGTFEGNHALLRKLLVGLYMVACGKMRAAALVQAFRLISSGRF